MSDLADVEALAMAGYWMYLWADCWRARSEIFDKKLLEFLQSNAKAMYTQGAPGTKDYRPADDPHPMCFVFLQVEHCLGTQDGPIWLFAKHVWRDRRPPETFSHPELGLAGRTSMYKLRQRILDRLAAQIRERVPEMITIERLKQARQRLKLERSRRQPLAQCAC